MEMLVMLGISLEIRSCWGVSYSKVEGKGHLFPRARSGSEFELSLLLA